MALAPDLATCNLALAQVPSAPISSTSEQSLAAREVTRVYAQCLVEMLERHPFRIARTRATLAAVTNDRPYEWASAFALPNDIASTQGIHLDPNAEGAWSRACLDSDYLRFEIAGTTLYANLPGVILEYTTNELLPGNFSAMFRNALTLEMAARIVMPIIKSRERQGDLIKAATGAWNRAVADDVDQAPQTMLDFPPHDALARYTTAGNPYNAYGWQR